MALLLEHHNWCQILRYAGERENRTTRLSDCKAVAHRVASTCKGLQAPAEATLYKHLLILDRESADLLSTHLVDPRQRKSQLISRHTRSINIGFRPMSPAAGFIDLIKTAERLEEFSCPGIGTTARPGLALLPPSIFDALVEHRSGTLRRLNGVSLYGGGCEAERFVQKLAKFKNLEELCTGPIWLPTPCSKSLAMVDPVRGLGASRYLLQASSSAPTELFASLRILQASFVASNHLFQHLLRAELPNIQHLRVAGWQQDALVAFLERHGSKLRTMDLHGRYAEFWSYRDPEQEVTLTQEVLIRCPTLQRLILHGSATLHDLTRYGEVHPELRSIHLSSSSTEGLWRVAETESDAMSYPFLAMSWMEETSRMIDSTDWRAMFPRLQELTIFMPGRGEAEQLEVVESWKRSLGERGIQLRSWRGQGMMW